MIQSLVAMLLLTTGLMLCMLLVELIRDRSRRLKTLEQALLDPSLVERAWIHGADVYRKRLCIKLKGQAACEVADYTSLTVVAERLRAAGIKVD